MWAEIQKKKKKTTHKKALFKMHFHSTSSKVDLFPLLLTRLGNCSNISAYTESAVVVGRPLQSASHRGLWALGSPSHHSLTHLRAIYSPSARGVTSDTKWCPAVEVTRDYQTAKPTCSIWRTIKKKKERLWKHSHSKVSLENVFCLLLAQERA